MRRSWIILFFILGLSLPAYSLFTGNDQYDINQLDTERQLDTEYFLALLSYRPFWLPAPGAVEPRGFVRTTDGSLTGEEFYIHREIGIRGNISNQAFWGYQLRQQEDLEQKYFYQYFEGQAPITGPLSFRIFGQPTSKKQDSDIGAGLVLNVAQTAFTLEGTLVDFLFNSKNLGDQHDRRKIYNVAAKLKTVWDGGAGEIAYEWDSPLEREFREEAILFDHRGTGLRGRAQSGAFFWNAFYLNEHRTTRNLPDVGLLQDFRKRVIGGEGRYSLALKSLPAQLGLQVQERRADLMDTRVPSESGDLRRWELDPYAALDIPFAQRWCWELAFFSGFIWQTADFEGGSSTHDFTYQARLKTGLRINFTPDVSLVGNPTWDLDRFGTGRMFDGGNVQFRARLP